MKWAALICALLLATILGVWAFFHAATMAARDVAEHAAEAVFSILHLTPQVMVKNTVLVQQSRSILEVATQTQTLVVETDYTDTTLGSTKRLHLRGQFTVKAGFDLRQDFRVTVSDDGRTARADFPEPEILSAELGHYEVIEDANGWWNYLTPADREKALADLMAQARTTAAKSGLLEQARRSLEEQLHQRGRWEIRFRSKYPEVRPLFPKP